MKGHNKMAQQQRPSPAYIRTIVTVSTYEELDNRPNRRTPMGASFGRSLLEGFILMCDDEDLSDC